MEFYILVTRQCEHDVGLIAKVWLWYSLSLLIPLCSLQAYTARNLKGLTVEHSSEMIKASDKILTYCRQACGPTRLTRILKFLGRQKSCVDIKGFRFVDFIYFLCSIVCGYCMCANKLLQMSNLFRSC